MKKYRSKAVALSTGLLAAMALQLTSSTAAGVVKTETSIAGVAVSLDACLENRQTMDTIKKILLDQIETEPETQETESPAKPNKEENKPITSGRVVSIAPNYVNVRMDPNTDGKIVGKMYTGAVGNIHISKEMPDGIWYHIGSGKVNGWVKGDFFRIGQEADDYMAQHNVRVGTVNRNANNLNVRSQASVTSLPITVISRGAQVAIVGEEGDFYKINLYEGCDGFVHKDYIDVAVKYQYAVLLSEERLQIEQGYESQQSSDNEKDPAEAEASRAQEEAEAEAMRIQLEAEAAARAESIAAAEAEARRQAEEAAKQSSIAAEQEAATQAPAQIVPVGVQATYIGGAKVQGQAVSAAELRVLGLFSDGNAYAVDGWGCAEVGVPLNAGQNTFTVQYAGFTTQIVVQATVPQTTAPPPTQAVPPKQPEQPAQPQGSNAELRNKLVAYGLQFVGNPYVYGGTDLVNGTDCSGFTMGCYRSIGINLLRCSYQQATQGKEIPLSAVQPGDLIFYMNYSTGVIGHVAMYIGNGQIVHAANASLGILVMDMYYTTPCKAVSLLG